MLNLSEIKTKGDIFMSAKIAVIGGGVVGSTTAYFLSKDNNNEVTIFDEGSGQGTSASAGIVSPWLSRRRNKKWYRMVKESAAFYPTFLNEVMDGKQIPSSVYNKVGTLLFKKKPEYLEEMLDIGLKRRKNAPEIGELKILSPEEIKEKFPIYENTKSALWAEGGARVDGSELVRLLIQTAVNQGARFVSEKAVLSENEDGTYQVNSNSVDETFEKVVLANAAWLKETLKSLGYEVDIRAQKGQLAELYFENQKTGNWPVIMPEGEKDIIPFDDGRFIIGATHENDKEFDLTIQKELLNPMIEEAIDEFSSEIANAKIINYRSGTRGFTSDHSPFFGRVPELDGVVAASGLGSTGLTAGPLVGKVLSEIILNQETSLPLEDYPADQYIQKKKD